MEYLAYLAFVCLNRNHDTFYSFFLVFPVIFAVASGKRYLEDVEVYVEQTTLR